jgi:hypothetical protein
MKQKGNAIITSSVMSVILLFVIFGTFFFRDMHWYEVYWTRSPSNMLSTTNALPLLLIG